MTPLLRRYATDGRSLLYISFFLFGVTWIASEGNARLMWERFHIPYLTPPFADTITVTYSIDALDKGHDPYLYRGIDPFGRVYNYPRIWLGLRHLGLSGAHTNLFGVLLAAAFLIAFACLLPRLGLFEGVIAAVAVFSSGPMLAVERGNIDLVVFVLLAVASFLFVDRRRNVAPFALVLLAAMGKLYPAACLANYVRLPPNRRTVAALATGALFALYVVLTLADLRVVSANTPRETVIAYGSAVAFQLYKSAPALSHLAKHIETPGQAAAVGDAIAFGLFGLVWIFQRLLPPPALELRGSGQVTMHAFGAGVAVYVGSFLLGNNFDYRLSLLLLALPQLFLWAREPSRRRLPSMLALGLIVAALNGPRIDDLGFRLTDLVIDWVLCVVLFALYLPTCRVAARRAQPSPHAPRPALA